MVKIISKMAKKQIPKKLRIEVWNKYIGESIGKAKCKCCEISDITQLTFHCGHIIAEAKGGDVNIDNLLPICGMCNGSMGTTNLYDFQKSLQPKNTSNMKNEDKQKLKELLDKSLKCCSMYYIKENNTHGINENVTRDFCLKQTNGDEKPYKLIKDTYDLFFTTKGNINKVERFVHDKCGDLLLVQTHWPANEHRSLPCVTTVAQV